MKRKNIVLLLGMAGFIVMADNWVVSPILPAISENKVQGKRTGEGFSKSPDFGYSAPPLLLTAR